MAVCPAARTVRPERPSSVPPGRRFWGGPAAVLQSANSAPPGLFVLPNRQPRRASSYLLDTTASLQLPTDGARMAMGFCWIAMGAHAAALARHRTKGARGERYGPPGRTLGALSPALFSVEKTKNKALSLTSGKSPASVYTQLPAAAGISWEKEYPCLARTSRRASRARAMRDFTVPTSIPSSSDIST